MFLAPCWRLETSPRPFSDFNLMSISEIWQFSGVDIYHFNSPLYTLSKNETLETWPNSLLSNSSKLLNWKEPVTQPQSSKSFKRFQKNIPLAYIYQLTKFGGLMSCGSKDIFKTAPCPMN